MRVLRLTVQLPNIERRLASGRLASAATAAAATACARQRHRSRQRRVLASRIWS